MSQAILLATSNQGKVRELRAMLEDFDVELRDLSDFPGIGEVSETGRTFADNARLKAVGYATQTGLWSIADDSGLEIEALQGRPGVFSARYGGDDLPFPDKMRLLLNEIYQKGDNRRARFVCSIAIADETGTVLFEADGVCPGQIADYPRGTGGFGYDPIFVPDGFDLTFGELPDIVKQKISHRAAALTQIIPFLRHFNAD